MERPQPLPEHLWLQALVGEYTFEDEYQKGVEKVYGLGDVWLVIEGRDETEANHYQFLLGYDPEKGKFVGTFACSFMMMLWSYEGQMQDNVLVLLSEGPRFDGQPGTCQYRDSIWLEDGVKHLKSEALGEDGVWTPFMNSQAKRIG